MLYTLHIPGGEREPGSGEFFDEVSIDLPTAGTAQWTDVWPCANSTLRSATH
jgi:hypothetical protein